jgi:hypothetical protein
MGRVGVLVLATFVLSRCATPSSGTRHVAASAEHPLDLLASENGKLGWGGVFIGRSRADIEQVLQRSLAVEAQEAPACGQWSSDASIAGRQIMLQWSSQGPEAELESIYVPLLPSEVETESALARRAVAHVPGLHPVAGGGEPSLFLLSSRETADTAVLLKPSEPDRCFFVSYDGCLD